MFVINKNTMMDSEAIPENMRANIKKLSNYYRGPVRVVPLTNLNYKAGDEIVINLPPNTIIDLSSFRLNFNAQCTGSIKTVAGFPKKIASLIDTFSVYIGGQLVQYIQNYNQLINILDDYTESVEGNSKFAVCNNENPSERFVLNDDGTTTRYILHPASTSITSLPVQVQTSYGYYSINQWPNTIFSENTRPGVIYTGVLPDFQIRIRLAQPYVLWCNDANVPTDLGYSLTNLYATFDKIQWSDPTYHSLMESVLEHGSMSIVFENARWHQGQTLSNGSKENIFRFTESVSSLNKVMFSYLQPDYTTIKPLQLANGLTKIYQNNTTDIDGSNVTAESIISNSSTTTVKEFSYDWCVETQQYPLNNTSYFFTRNGLGLGDQYTTGLGTVQLEVNSTMVNPWKYNLVELYQETLKAFDLHINDEGISDNIKSIANYEGSSFLGAYRFNHIDDDDDIYLLSGLDSAQTSIIMALYITAGTRSTNNAANGIPYVFTQFDSVLKVRAGRSVEIEF